MKNLQVKKTAIALAMATLTLVTTTEIMPGPLYYTKYSISSNYEQNSSIEPFAHLEIGDVYIGTKEEIRKLDWNTRRGNIIIIDERHLEDANIKVQDSYKIKNVEDIASVVAVIQEYNDKYPSNWKRSSLSLINEWQVHNICSDLSIMPSHTDDVDLNNGDEFLYNSKLLSKVINMNL